MIKFKFYYLPDNINFVQSLHFLFSGTLIITMQLINLLILALCLIFVYLFKTNIETFPNFRYFNNVQSGTRRNMSYDLRGDPYIPFRQVSPWNNPESFPIRNREMIME